MSTEADFPSDLRALEDEYELIRELGHGGIAAVYLARKRASGQVVAIKAIRARYLDDPDALKRFAREARTVADLDHPNIVRTEAIKQIDDRAVAIIMEHVPGGTLRDRLREHGALGAEHTEGVLRDIAAALAYAHRRGIIHRDVKPENVFLNATSGRALLSDFGIARRIEGDTDITLLGAALGTPQYMSPEQIDGTQLDGRSDIYSLGVVGWEILTGRRPWAGENLYGIIYKQKHEDLPRITSLRPRVPANLLFAIEGALVKDRTKRWQSADEFIERLTYNPPPVVAQEYPAAVSPADDEPTVMFRRPIPVSSGADERQPFPSASYALPTFGPNADTTYEVDRTRARVLRGLALLAPLTIAAVSLFVVLSGSSRDAPARPETRVASGGSIAADSTRVADAGYGSRPVPAILPETARTPGDPRGNASGVLLSPPKPSERTPPRITAPSSRARTTASARAPSRASPAPAPVPRNAVAESSLAAGRTDTASAADSVTFEDPFRPPTSSPSTSTGETAIPSSPAGALPSPRCRLASTADQRACLDAYVAIGDAPMQRALDALVVELRRISGVASDAPDPTTVARVRVEHRAWLSVRSSECRRLPSLEDGPFWAPAHAQCYHEMAASRASELQDAVRRLRRR